MSKEPVSLQSIWNTLNWIGKSTSTTEFVAKVYIFLNVTVMPRPKYKHAKVAKECVNTRVFPTGTWGKMPLKLTKMPLKFKINYIKCLYKGKKKCP